MIILTTFARPGYLRRALDAGVAGYVLKDAPAEQLADARAPSGGRAQGDRSAARARRLGGRVPAHRKGREVLRRAGEGQPSGQIARELHLSEGTVRNYLSEAIGKTGAANRIEAARVARDKGWL